MATMTNPGRPAMLVRWLLAVAGLVVAMVIVGGITRLTESGLSITEWKPVTGAIPPLTHEQWMIEFEKYRQIPEYQRINKGMSLADFQFIFFWEWAHRLLGRLIGLAFAVPLAVFAWKRWVPSGYGKRLLALLALGGLQGAIGWWMVVSGLSVRTDVSHYRLAVHLLTALTILAGLVWTARDLATGARARLTPGALAVIAVLFVQLLLGAWVAGLDAGYVANTWPLMNERLVPDGIDWSKGALWAFTNDPFLLHFLHRWWAWVAFGALLWLARAAKRAGERRASIALHAALGTQILLGIITVESGVNIVAAVAHQGVGALLVAATAWAAHAAGRTLPASVVTGYHTPKLA